jgi:serine protease Do
MKSRIHVFVAALSLIALVPALQAAEEKSASKTEEKSTSREEKKGMRVLAAPGRDPRIFLRDERRDKVEMETVAFLGVETAPVSTTTGVQLGLPKGTGLVVNHVVAKSPAEGVLKEHDILLKLDEQILIETRQLSVLIRTRQAGDEVVLTYLRGGQKATAKIKLGKTEAPKLADIFERNVMPFGAFAAGAPFEFATEPRGERERADVDRVLSMIKRAPNGDPVRIQVDPHRGPGFRAMTLHTDNSSLVFSDDEGSLELTAQDGVKSLVAKDAKGETLFSGLVNSPEERKAMPAEVRARLEKLEGMQDVTFRTDGDFRPGQVKVMRPRGIAFPFSESPGMPARARTFY